MRPLLTSGRFWSSPALLPRLILLISSWLPSHSRPLLASGLRRAGDVAMSEWAVSRQTTSFSAMRFAASLLSMARESRWQVFRASHCVIASPMEADGWLNVSSPKQVRRLMLPGGLQQEAIYAIPVLHTVEPMVIVSLTGMSERCTEQHPLTSRLPMPSCASPISSARQAFCSVRAYSSKCCALICEWELLRSSAGGPQKDSPLPAPAAGMSASGPLTHWKRHKNGHAFTSHSGPEPAIAKAATPNREEANW